MRILNILVVEDDLNRIEIFKKKLRNHKMHFALTAPEAINALTKNEFDLIFLDHDLGGGAYEPSDENSGYGVAKFMEAEGTAGDVIIHSLNPAGAANMHAALPHAHRIPFMGLFNDPRLSIWDNDA